MRDALDKALQCFKAAAFKLRQSWLSSSAWRVIRRECFHQPEVACCNMFSHISGLLFS
jgi:hypothetical protein